MDVRMLEADPAWDDSTLDPKEIHEYLCALARDDAARDVIRGEWLLKGLVARVWEPLGYGSFVEYAERTFGWGPRTTEARVRVAEALRELPAMREALYRGRVTWSAVREVTRVAVPETEDEWLAAIEGKTVREIERMVVDRSPGDGPNDPPLPSAKRYVLRFDVDAATKAVVDEARTVAVRNAGHRLSDDDLLGLMARALLAAGAERSADPGRANYQIQMTVCERCGHGEQQAGGERVTVRPEVVEAALCDCAIVPADSEDEVGATRPRGREADAEPERPRGRNTNVETGRPRGRDSDAQPERPRGRDSDAHLERPRGRKTDAEPGRPRGRGTGPESKRPRGRARQPVPPALRRKVYARDRGRCAVPGCRHCAFLDLHHLKLVSEGGAHDLDNLILLCSVHHTAVHEGRMIIRGTPSEGLRFHHADGSIYGVRRPEMPRIDHHRRAFAVLCNLGFGQGQVRAALDDVAAHVGERHDTETLVRAALDRLRKGVVSVRDEGPGYFAPPAEFLGGDSPHSGCVMALGSTQRS